MNETAEPEPGAGRRVNGAESAGWGAVSVGLAILWLLLPALQYLGTTRRTELALGRTDTVSPLAVMDLTPWYVLLLGVSLACAAIRTLAARGAGGEAGRASGDRAS